MKSGNLHVIDISKIHPKKEIILQNVAEIEYIPLETTDEILLSGLCQLAYLSEKYIVVWEPKLFEVFIFDRNGRIRSHFNHKGQGDKEYTIMRNVIFDEQNEEIFVFNVNSILVYNLNGEYKRTLKYSNDFSRIDAYNFDNDSFLIYDNSNMFFSTYNKKPYMIMSKKDGSIVSTLDIFLPVRYYNGSYYEVEANGQNMTMSLYIDASNNRYYGKNLLLADISSDTIYLLSKNKELTPLIVRKPSVHSAEPRTVLTHQFSTDKFIFLYKIILDFDAAQNGRSITNKELIYEFANREISEVSFVNDDYPSLPWWGAVIQFPETPHNVTASLIPTYHLKKVSKENKLKGELKKMVATLNEEDNPVLMIVKFK
jgi:hypothetical protein